MDVGIPAAARQQEISVCGFSTANAVAAELQSEFTALQDLPDFSAGPMRKGERLFINTIVLYDAQDGKFTRIRSAELRKIHRPSLGT
jgi:hypothetical protein